MGNFNTGIFSKPRYSSFPWSHGNRISMDAGKIVPIAWDYLDTGEKFELNSVGNVTRIAPMLAPTLDTYKVDIHAFAVRLRSIGMASRNPWTYEDFFNLNTNSDGSARLPMIPLDFIIGVNRFRNNTFFEAMGIPTFKNLREDYLEYLRAECPEVFDTVYSLVRTPIDSTTLRYTLTPASYNVGFISAGYDKRFDLNGTRYYYAPTTLLKLPFFKTLLVWLFTESEYKDILIERLCADFNSVSNNGVQFILDCNISDSKIGGNETLDVLGYIYDTFKVDSITIVNDYIEYLLDSFWVLRSDGVDESSSYPVAYKLGNVIGSLGYVLLQSLPNNFPDLPRESVLIYLNSNNANSQRSVSMIPSYPFEAYWKIISDWFINTAIFEPDAYFIDKTRFVHWDDVNLTNYTYWNAYADKLKEALNFANRYWKNDYFTSCFPDAQVGQAVSIPVNGTIVDLRNANSMQKLKERLLYAGRRFRDVLYSITGKRTSSAIMDMSEVLGMWSNVINVDSVLQQSASENGQPLANYAGTGLGYRSGGKGCFYTAEEPTVIMFVASITPKASYFQGLHKKFQRANVYDYDIPQLANIGEEVVRTGELYLDKDSVNITSPTMGIFGYQRRNASFMWTPDEVHGDFRGSLDYWHNARVFGSKPSLSETFLTIQPKRDNLNRIWAVTSDSLNHFYCHFTFIGNVIRHLPKHVHYDL